MAAYQSIDKASQAVAQKIIDAQPALRQRRVREGLSFLSCPRRLILHAGPPIAFEGHAGTCSGSRRSVLRCLKVGHGDEGRPRGRSVRKRRSSHRTITSHTVADGRHHHRQHASLRGGERGRRESCLHGYPRG